jgi:S1-C subfamily serine protease
MSFWKEIAVPALLGFALGFALVAIVINTVPRLHPSPLDGVVKVELDGGHGSGVHLGGGLILTANHVVSGEDNIEVRDAAGFTASAKVLWASKEFDTALLQTSYAGPSAALRCAPIGMGEGIQAAGSPGKLEFITTYGHTAASGPVGVDSQIGVIQTIVMDINGGQGMSGGPVFDAQHRVIGIMSLITNPKDLRGSFAFAIPATDICRLLAR